MTILGVTASSILKEVGSFDSISTATGTGSSGTITFSSLPTTYTHLQIRYVGRVTNADTGENLFIQFNSDTGTNYTWHYVEGTPGAPTTSGSTNATRILSGRLSAANAAANIMGVGIIDILDYRNTSKNKTVKTESGQDRNSVGQKRWDSGVWRSTSAITSITLINGSGTNFTTASVFALYGIEA